uniref:Thrombomodulin n=1 Tax=Oryzias latipes TaxID=8090 RepID=A0A3B3ILB6_ORYLA
MTNLLNGLNGRFWVRNIDGEEPSRRCSAVSARKGQNATCVSEPCQDRLDGFLCQFEPGDTCEGGHLMTMRSNRLSPQMASLLLLTNSNGEFWIGLHRLGDCPDPEKKLRGFQWVTNDEETNYTNWSPSFDSSCSSPSCVHVSTRNSLQWVQAPCDGKATGFVCARGNSCPELEAEQTGDACMDVDECALGPCEHICVNVVGSYVCLCSDGHRVSPKSPDKCDIYCNKEECPAKCDPNNMFQCFCPDGFLLEERGTSMICVDIDECQSFSCDQDCKNTYGSYECSCYPGFTLTKRGGCKEDNEENGTEGSGLITPISDATSPFVPFPDPTRSPSGVTPGGLGGIIVWVWLVLHLKLLALKTQ